MKTEIGKNLIDIIRSVVIDGSDVSGLSLTEDEMHDLFVLAKAHQVEHIAAYALSKLQNEKYAGLFYSSLSNTTRQTYDLSRISKAFLEKKIPFIVLKGPVVRRLYPAAWMRNSSDIDILVKEEDLSRAGEVLESLSYKKEEGLSAHDVSYKTDTVHVELHFTLIEKYRFAEISNILSAVWENCTTENGVEYVMTDEYYYFYHVAHMVKHFVSGGCGIRSILDLWILNHRTEFDKSKRDALLSRGEILKFEKELVRLSEYWFSLSEEAGLTTLENFIFSGGAYGEIKNSVAIKKSMRGGKFKYLMHRLFAPYSQLVKYYPRLAKYPILLPYYEVKRWIQAMRRDGKTYRREFSENMKNDKSEGEVDKMLDTLGIR